MFCPLMKGECKQEECMFWAEMNGNQGCVLLKALMNYLPEIGIEESLEDDITFIEKRKILQALDPEDLAERAFDFINKRVKDYKLKWTYVENSLETYLEAYLKKEFGEEIIFFFEDPELQLKIVEAFPILSNKLKEKQRSIIDELDTKILAENVLKVIKEKMSRYNLSFNDVKRSIDDFLIEYLEEQLGDVESLQIKNLDLRLKLQATRAIIERKLLLEEKRELFENIDSLVKEFLDSLDENITVENYEIIEHYLDTFLSERYGEIDYKARRLIIGKVIEEIEQRRLAKEKKMIPELVKQLVEWARKQGLKTLRKMDVESFLIERGLEDLHHHTINRIWKLASTELKKRQTRLM